jgi:class 3 adenylate cyclase
VSQSIDTGPRATIRTIVASFLFTDLVGFSKGTAADQYSAKAQLTALLRRDLAMLRESDYWIKDTGDGALIAFVSNPEHALYVALALGHDYGGASGGDGAASNSLRTGLHLGTVKESTDLEGRRNFVGDGINAAKRIMDFAVPGQITASRSFFEAIANLDSAYGALFEHLGAPDDKHGRTHELYAVSRSEAVLEKLKTDLATEVGEGPATETPGAKTAAEAPSAGPRGAVARITRPVSLIVITLLVLVGVASTFYVTGQREAPSTATRKAPEPAAKPAAEAAKPPPESAKPALESTKPAPELAAPAPMSDQQRPRASAQDSAAVPSSSSAGSEVSGSASPASPAPAPSSAVTPAAVTKAAPTTSPVPAAKQRPAALPPASMPSASTSEGPSPRCSRIVEKAAVGEQLTQEEKRELATCR